MSSSITEKGAKLLKTTPVITDLGLAGLACLHEGVGFLQVSTLFATG